MIGITISSLSIISILGIFLNVKNHAKSNLVSYLAVTIAAVGVLIAIETGTSGGAIRHTEIRDSEEIVMPITSEKPI